MLLFLQNRIRSTWESVPKNCLNIHFRSSVVVNYITIMIKNKLVLKTNLYFVSRNVRSYTHKVTIGMLS